MKIPEDFAVQMARTCLMFFQKNRETGTDSVLSEMLLTYFRDLEIPGSSYPRREGASNGNGKGKGGLDRSAPMGDDDPMPFGKYKGVFLKDVPTDYFDWLYAQDWIDQWPALHAYIKEDAGPGKERGGGESFGMGSFFEKDNCNPDNF